MKYSAVFLSVFLILGCNRSSDTEQLQKRVDSLEKKLAEAYKPGLGEFMSGIQVHHAKLWFAGINANWPLADFEIHEIGESLEDIKKFAADRPETRAIGMIDASIDSVSKAIAEKSTERFRATYLALTNTCNNCHRETEHGFNIVKVPDAPPLPNQEFGGK